MFAVLIAVVLTGWAAAALIGSQAYFRGEQSKPIHDRNWNSDAFEQLATTVTGRTTDYSERIPNRGLDAYTAQNFSA